jgi:hypothetical protein
MRRPSDPELVFLMFAARPTSTGPRTIRQERSGTVFLDRAEGADRDLEGIRAVLADALIRGPASTHPASPMDEVRNPTSRVMASCHRRGPFVVVGVIAKEYRSTRRDLSPNRSFFRRIPGSFQQTTTTQRDTSSAQSK